MFEGVRPFDWLMLIIEALVLLLILYEVVAEATRRRTERQRSVFIARQVLALSRLMDHGQSLQSTVPEPQITSDYQIIQRWMDSVTKWTEGTNGFLVSQSSVASAAFLLVTDASAADNLVHRAGRSFLVGGELGRFYQRLVMQLANLRRIIERPEAYF
jgi:hypothetical protein